MKYTEAARMKARRVKAKYVGVRSKVMFAPGVSAAAWVKQAAADAIKMPGRASQAAVVDLPRGGVLSLSASFSLAALGPWWRLGSGVFDFSECSLGDRGAGMPWIFELFRAAIIASNCSLDWA